MEIPDIVWIVLLHSILFGVACYFIGASRQIGAVAGAFIGLILGVIGLVIVLCSGRKEPIHFTDQLQKYKALFDSGSITATE